MLWHILPDSSLTLSEGSVRVSLRVVGLELELETSSTTAPPKTSPNDASNATNDRKSLICHKAQFLFNCRQKQVFFILCGRHLKAYSAPKNGFQHNNTSLASDQAPSMY